MTRHVIDIGLNEEGINYDVILESSNPQILSQMVKLGFCNSVLPEKEASKGITKSQKIAERTLVALTRKSSPPNIRVKSLIQMAADCNSG